MNTRFRFPLARKGRPATGARLRVAAATLGLVACVGAAPKAAPPAAPNPVNDVADTQASNRSAAPPRASDAIPFVEDDYAKALAAARARHVPLFVDAWASWCHTCLSMRAFVLADTRLHVLEGDYVFLAIDTEKPENAAFLAKYPMDTWPTLWLIDSEHERPVLKWTGAATAPELVTLLQDSKVAAKQNDSGGDATAAFLQGQQAWAAGNGAIAVEAYRKSLALAPAAWPRRAQLDEAYVSALLAQKDYDGCLTLAQIELPKMPKGTAAANVALGGLACAKAAEKPSDQGKRPVAAQKNAVSTMLEFVRGIATDTTQPILADDRSGLYEELVGTYQEHKQRDLVKETAQLWLAFLDEQAQHAPTKEARAVFDAHRLLADIAVGEPGRAVPMLEASEQDFPRDYNPPARLAKAYLEMGKYDEAIKAIDRALARVYGGRELRLVSLKTDILLAKGDTLGAKTYLKDALVQADQKTLSPNYQKLESELRKRLNALTKATDH